MGGAVLPHGSFAPLIFEKINLPHSSLYVLSAASAQGSLKILSSRANLLAPPR